MDKSGPLRVIFTVDSFTKASLGGGLIRHIKYARPLRERGIEFEWLTIESDADEAFQQRWAVRVRVVPMSADLPVQKKREVLLREAFREAAQRPSGARVVATDSCGVTPNTALQIWRARLRGIPSTHNTSMAPGPFPTRWAGHLRLRLLGGLFFRGLRLLIPQTRSIERVFAGYFGLPRSQMEVIGNGVDCAAFSPAVNATKLAARHKLGLPADAPVVLSVGSIVPRKGTDILIRSWSEVLRRFPSAKLVIAGTLGRRSTFMDTAATLDDYAKQILALIEKLPDPTSVLLTRREVEDVLDYYHAADAFAFASEREGLPNVVLEAMACGLPCVLLAYDGFPASGEELGEPGTHFVASERTDTAFARNIMALLADPARCVRIGGAARELMLQTQNLDRVLDRWAAMYHRVATS